MSSDTIESRSPQDPDEVVQVLPAADRSAVAGAVDAARDAAHGWASGPALNRTQALTAAADELAAQSERFADLMVREVGKPAGEAAGEVARGVGILRYFAQQALDPDGQTYPAPDGTSLLMARRYPHGVVGLITPWNFPLAIPLWKAAPALAFGNGVVLKPSPYAIGCALELSNLLDGVLPEGLFSMVAGAAEAGEALVDTVDAVSFTGSVDVGRQVALAATGRHIPVQAEMGGQNASLVLPDADRDAAAASVAAAAMGYAGQKCTATSRVIVVGNPEPFTEALADAVRGLGVGDPGDADTVVGPVISEDARRKVLDAAEKARADGGNFLTGGRAGQAHGHFVEPTLVTGLPPDAELAREEVFGPIAAVLPARDTDEAVQISNGVRYGLVTSVFTRDLDRALELVGRLDTGMLKVNAPTSGVDFHAPFGGEKASSIGPREQGKAARDFYTSTRTITMSPLGA
ncbi:MAG: aldehyde dehydrogenase family protein [Actinomycetota bacterium]|nr:aldehyde dehydrogenase family protein [Actinomycetota bacterium]